MKMIVILTLFFFAVLSAAQSNSCFENPYFNTNYTPEAISVIPNQSEIAEYKALGAVYDTQTGIWDFANFTSLNVCPDLKNTGSCCSPSLLQDTSKAYTMFIETIKNISIDRYEWRIKKYNTTAKVLGKSVSAWVDVFSRTAAFSVKILQSWRKIYDGFKNKTALEKKAETNLIFKLYTKGVFPSLHNLARRDLKSIINDIQIYLALTKDYLLIGKNRIKTIKKELKMISDANDKFFVEKLMRFEAQILASVSSATKENYQIVNNLIYEFFNKTRKTQVQYGNGSIDIARMEIYLPVIFDNQYVEYLAKVIYEVTKTTNNISDFFDSIAGAKDTILQKTKNYQDDIPDISSIQVGGDLFYTKLVVTRFYYLIFQRELNKIIQASNNKMKCLNTALKFQGYILCLSCNPTALTKKLIITYHDRTFKVAVDHTFVQKLREDCSEYIKDLIDINANFDVNDVFFNLDDYFKNKYDDNDKGNDNDINNVTDDNRFSLDTVNQKVPNNLFDTLCDVTNSKCSWIENNFINVRGIDLAFLVNEGTTEDLPANAPKGRRPRFNQKERKENITLKEDKSEVEHGYIAANESSDNVNVSSTETNFSSHVTYTIDKDKIESIHINPTTEKYYETSAGDPNIPDSGTNSNLAPVIELFIIFKFLIIIAIIMVSLCVLGIIGIVGHKLWKNHRAKQQLKSPAEKWLQQASLPVSNTVELASAKP